MHANYACRCGTEITESADQRAKRFFGLQPLVALCDDCGPILYPATYALLGLN
jgi:hypothetical protein